MQQLMASRNEKNIVCVSSYDDSVLKGWFYSPCQDVQYFSSLSQFLVKMEETLDYQQMPQAYTSVRRFPMLLQDRCSTSHPAPKGVKATFELTVTFRQNTSWQGSLLWREQNLRKNFRSVLELVMLMDSALRSLEGSDIA